MKKTMDWTQSEEIAIYSILGFILACQIGQV